MKKLKALYFEYNEELNEYQVIGKYRETERGGLNDTEEYSRVILDHGKDYHCIRATLKKLAQANNVEPFDFVSEPFMESLAKMKRD